jgi:IclR family pca regulon transcriptional regulator
LPELNPQKASSSDGRAKPVKHARDTDPFAGDPNFMTSLARGLAVIQAFSQRRHHLTISQVSTTTGLSRAAVRRCLYTLAKLGFAGSDDNRQFFLRPRILALGHSYISSMPLATAAQPVLEHISHLLHESCSIATLDAVLARIEFKRFTERTIVNPAKLTQVLRQIRRDGYSIIDQELEHGLRSMAVPIQNPGGKVVAALNIGAHAQRVSIQEMQTKFLPHLRAAAQELCLLLK